MKKIFIEGMSCMNCVRHVKEAIMGIAGTSDVNVELQGKYAILEAGSEVSDENLKKAIEEAGYDVTGIMEEKPEKGCGCCG